MEDMQSLAVRELVLKEDSWGDIGSTDTLDSWGQQNEGREIHGLGVLAPDTMNKGGSTGQDWAEETESGEGVTLAI